MGQFAVEKNPQKANEYAFYEIFTSYYKKSICISEVLEKRLKLYFLDYADKKQELMEQTAEVLIENIIGSDFDLSELEKEEVSVKIVPGENKNILVFDSNNYKIKIDLTFNGKVLLNYKIIKKEA